MPAQLLTVPYTAIQFIALAQFQNVVKNSKFKGAHALLDDT